MGDLNFNIFKDVNLNKTVNLDINKTVTVNVENKDLLATAEADAEAFGLHGLAEVDAYTYVRETPGGEKETIFTFGEIGQDGDVLPFDGILAGDDILVSFTTEADVDDTDGIGALFPIDGDPNGQNDIPLPAFGPDPVTGDDPVLRKSLTDLSLINGTLIAGNIYEYQNESPWVEDLGNRWVDRNGDGLLSPGEYGALTLTIPDGDNFDVIFEDPGIEIDYNDSNAFWTFTPDTTVTGESPHPANNDPFTAPADIVFEIGSLAVEGNWLIEATGNFPYEVLINGGDGEAFAYAESSSAIDLDII